ncbi:transglutaminase domain-containing protein [candidate division WOR-3 bacterium]|nr:transglutaminase domain-containing protein [candidate division WOR-3 bacterium]
MKRVIVCKIIFLISLLLEVFTIINVEKDNRLFDTIVRETTLNKKEKEKILALFNWTHINVKIRNGLPPFDWFITPRSVLTHGSNCGGFSKVFAVLLRRDGFPARLLFLYQNKIPVHVVTEVYHKKRWVVFDPFYGYYYPMNDTLLATAEDLKRNPNLLQKFVNRTKYPINFYTYQDVRRTNWTKIPIISSKVYKLIRIIIGEKVDKIALNVITLRIKILLTYCLLIPIVICGFFIVKSNLRKSK